MRTLKQVVCTVMSLELPAERTPREAPVKPLDPLSALSSRPLSPSRASLIWIHLSIAFHKPRYRNTNNSSHHAVFRVILSRGRGSLERHINQNCIRRRQVNISYRGCRTQSQARVQWYHWPCTSHPRGFHPHHRSSYLYMALLRTCRALSHGRQ
jgi:hypothetical protein